MLKKILSYGFIEGIAKGLNKLILLLLPFFLLTEDFGKIGLIIGLETLLPFITLLGFERVVLRFYQKLNQFSDFKKTIFSTILFTHFILLIIVVLFYLFGINEVFGLSLFPDVFLLILLIFLQGRNQIILNIYRVEENHKKYFKSRLLLQVLKFIIILSLVYYTKSYIGYLIGGIIVALFINIFHNIKISDESFNKATFLQFFMFSWPFIFHGISGNLLGNADRFIIEKYLTINDVGLYTFAYSFGSMIIFAYVGVSVYMEPQLYKSENLNSFNSKISSFLLYAFSMGLITLFVINVCTDFILPHFYKNYNQVLHYIPLIGLSYILYPFYLSSNYRLIYTQQTKKIAVLSIISSVINILLNFILIPKFGIYAAVLVTLYSYMIQAILFTYISNNKITFEIIQILIAIIVINFGVYFNFNNYMVLFLLAIAIYSTFYFNKYNYDK